LDIYDQVAEWIHRNRSRQDLKVDALQVF